MTHPSIQFNDLPDEILMHIFKQLNHVEALYSLLGVNQRLNRVLNEPIFIRDLHLIRHSPDMLSTFPLLDPVLDRFCSTILPKIGHQVKSLYLEALSMERILRATNYPNLYGLGLSSIEAEAATFLFDDENSGVHMLKNQISSFFIKFRNRNNDFLGKDIYPIMFTRILTIFTNLRSLIFNPTSDVLDHLYFDMSPPTIISSTLVELHVSVVAIYDCLYLLDGRFDQLRVLFVSLYMIPASPSLLAIEHKNLLPNLRVFSLKCDMRTDAYHEAIVPLLHRMVNLEQLHLNINVRCDEDFIDGNTLNKDIITHMPRLHKFSFNIYSTSRRCKKTNFPSNEDVQKTYEYFCNSQIISYIDHFHDKNYSQCQTYSYPYQLEIFENITNNFPGGLFTSVTEVSLYDEQPFEYEFFLRIAQSFPFMKELIIENGKPQKKKQLVKSNNDNQALSIIKYPNLRELVLNNAHDDYVELFLLDTKMSLPNNLLLSVNYESIERVTHNFTRDLTRKNCEKLASLCLYKERQVDEYMKDYFPHTNIF